MQRAWTNKRNRRVVPRAASHLPHYTVVQGHHARSYWVPEDIPNGEVLVSFIPSALLTTGCGPITATDCGLANWTWAGHTIGAFLTSPVTNLHCADSSDWSFVGGGLAKISGSTAQ